jgi:hypothetical protein
MVRLCVRIDLEKLARRLARREGVEYQPADVEDWLGWEGFFPVGDRWQCQGDLGMLEDDEILEIVRQFNHDGINYTVHEDAVGPLPV